LFRCHSLVGVAPVIVNARPNAVVYVPDDVGKKGLRQVEVTTRDPPRSDLGFKQMVLRHYINLNS
jgi:2-keto-3-deoxy-6-phosphogluconate aldolase